MSLVCSSSCLAPLPQHTKQSRSNFAKLKTCTLSLSSSVCYPSFTIGKIHRLAKSQILASQESFTENSTLDLDWDDQEEAEDTGSPWEGSVMYRRNASLTHVEYCTTLERLGLGRLSTDVSKARASKMGLRVTKDVKDYTNGTPVQVSVDVIRKKKKLRLEGIVRTVITLGCNRCGEPAGESIFSNFSLLLTEELVEEPDVIDLRFTFGNDKTSSFSGLSNDAEEGDDGEDDDDDNIDWEDKLHFPAEAKEIDVSKHIRDLIHLEITMNAICDPTCKGICLKCGANLNKRTCGCDSEEKDKGYGPLGNLRKQMQQKEGLRK
ncbi:unnamed protein product [Cochlearia groenlandica]